MRETRPDYYRTTARFVSWGRRAAARRGVGASRVFRGGFCAYSVRLFINRTPRGPLVVGRRAPDEGRQSPLVRERRAAGRRGEVPVWTSRPAVCEVPDASKRPSSRRRPVSEGNPAARSSAGVADVVARMPSVIATLSVQERRARRPLAGQNWRAAAVSTRVLMSVNMFSALFATSGTGCHRVQIIYFFRMQIGPRTPSGIGLRSGSRLHRMHRS